MIVRRRGDILKSDAEALVNTVNCVGVMGKGVALQFKETFPDMFRAYARACKAGEVRPGKMFTVKSVKDGQIRIIINFPTKDHWRGKSRYADIEMGLQALRDEIVKLGIKSIAIPPLGCGNGGLDWAKVGPMIEERLADLDVQIIIYEPSGAPSAREMPVKSGNVNMTYERALMIKMFVRYSWHHMSEMSKIEVHKLVYFLNNAGAKFRGLEFQKNQFGPHSRVIDKVMQSMEGHFVRGVGDGAVRAQITVLPQGVKEATHMLSDNPEAHKIVERVVHLIDGFESPFGLELLATVHWVATREITERACGPAMRDQVLEKVGEWSARKAARFSPRKVEVALETLCEQGWLEPALV